MQTLTLQKSRFLTDIYDKVSGWRRAMRSGNGQASNGAPEANGWRRGLLTGAGLISLAVAVLGVVLPVLPTTCFLLLALACFSRSSRRLSNWMMGNRWFGRYLRQYHESGTFDPKVKAASLGGMWTSLLISAAVLGWRPWITLGLMLLGLTITLHLVLIGRSRGTAPRVAGAVRTWS